MYRFSPLCLALLLALHSCGTVVQQEAPVEACTAGLLARPETSQPLPSGSELMVAFYNVENLFDTVDAPYEGDDFVFVEPKIGWDTGNYEKKLANLARAISSMGQQGPDILGLAEVENACVVADLIRQPALAERGYRIVHEESPDRRGIDVALIYDPNKFTFTSFVPFEVSFDDPDYVSRDILGVQGTINGQTLFMLVNHWPSRGGGQAESEPRRIAAARTAREVVSRIDKESPQAGVLLMGDFNDDPFNESMAKVLGAAPLPEESARPGLYNVMYRLLDPEREGSLTYRGKYNLFDQIVINEELVNQSGALGYVSGSATIHHPDFMRYKGRGPSRAIYRSEFQPDGFSDHFPVYLTLRVK
jgi:predicted extracellular nuclease